MNETTRLPLEKAAAALRRWAEGSLPTRTAVDIVLTTALRDVVVPHYLDWVSEDVARVDFDRLDDDLANIQGEARFLSGSGVTLVHLVANLTRGREGAGADLDLRRLWDLDDSNRRAVFKALRDTLLARNEFHHSSEEPSASVPSH